MYNRQQEALALNWQHPFVDVFRTFNISSFSSCIKKGDVKQVKDKFLKKTVYRIAGRVAASNFIEIPNSYSSKQAIQMKLTGRYAYFAVRSHPNRDCTMYVDVTTDKGHNMRVTISTRFEKQSRRDLNVNVPVKLSSKWTMIGVDLQSIVVKTMNQKFKYIRSITLGSNMYAKGVYTSDIAYSSSTIPVKMRIQRTDTPPFDFVWVPEIPEEVSNLRVPLQTIAALPRAPASMWTDLRRLGTRPFSLGDENASDRVEKAKQSCVLRPDPILKLHTVLGMNTKCGRKSSSSLSSSMKKTMLSSINTNVGPLWSRDGKEIVYASSNLIIAMKIDVEEEEEGDNCQRYFRGHVSDVAAICLSKRGDLLASAQVGQPMVVRLWNYNSAESLCMIVGSPKHGRHGFVCLDFSADSSLLCVTGHDDHAHQKIVLWDITGVGVGKDTPHIVAKQTSEYDVRRIFFSPFDPRRLVSCGEENIRFWRLRRRHLPAAAVILNEYTRGATFTDLAFETTFLLNHEDDNDTVETSTQKQQRRIFVSSSLGTVLQINYDTRGLECVFQLHDAPIHCICVNDGYCCTVSEDTLLRVWPLDFTDFFLEARHDGPVTALDISEDGCAIAVASGDGTMGVMDVVAQKYRTVLRTHRGKITCLALSGPADPDSSRHVGHVDYCHELAATISEQDENIRVWSSVTMEQIYEFCTKDDSPTCVDFLDDTKVICGFKSGHLRVFDTIEVKLTVEARPHRQSVIAIVCSSNGRRVFSYSSDNQVCSSDPRSNFEPISVMSVTTMTTMTKKKTYCKSSNVEMRISPDNSILAIAGENIGLGRVLLYGSVTLNPLLCLHADLLKTSFSRLRFSPVIFKDGLMTLVGTSGSECSMVLFNLQRIAKEETVEIKLNSVVQVPCIHRNEITSLAVSSDGRFVATGGADFLIKIWDITMPGMPIPPYQSFAGHSDRIDHIAFTSNASSLLSCAGSQMMRWNFLASPKIMSSTSPQIQHRHHEKKIINKKIAEKTILFDSTTKQDEEKKKEEEDDRLTPVDRLRMALRKRAVTISQVFGYMDSDRSDTLTFQELVQGLELARIHFQEDDAKALFQALDPDRDGRVCWADFETAVSGMKKCRSVSNQNIDIELRATDTMSSPDSMLQCVAGAAKIVIWHPPTAIITYAIRNHVILESLAPQIRNVEGKHQLVIASHTSSVVSLAITDDGDALSSASHDTVLVHALRNGLSMTSHLIWKKNITDFNVQSLCFDHTGRRLACSSLNGTRIDVWKTSSEGRNIKTLESTQVLCDAPVVWASHWALLAATIDSSIVMWTISEWEPRTIEFPKWLRNSRVEITALSCPSATTTSDHIAVAGFSDGRACIFKIINEEELEVLKTWHALRSPSSIVRNFVWSKRCVGNIQRLVVSGDHNAVHVFDVRWSVTSKSVKDIKNCERVVDVTFKDDIVLDDSNVLSISLDSAANEGVVLTRSGTMWVLNSSKSSIVRLRGGPRGSVSNMCASADGSYVVCVEEGGGTLSIRQCEGLKQVVRLTCAETCLDVACADRWMVATSRDGQIRLVDLKSMKVRHRAKVPFPFAATRVGFVNSHTIICCSESGDVAYSNVDEDDGRITNWRVASSSSSSSSSGSSSRDEKNEFVITSLSTSKSHFAVTSHSKKRGTRVRIWRVETLRGDVYLETTIDVERVMCRLDDSKSSARRRYNEASVVCLSPSSDVPTLLIASTGSDTNTIRIVVYSVSGDCVMASTEYKDTDRSSVTSVLPPFVPVTSAVRIINDVVVRTRDNEEKLSTKPSSTVALACTRGYIYFLDCETGTLIQKFRIPHAIIVNSLALISERSLVASSRGLIFSQQMTSIFSGFNRAEREAISRTILLRAYSDLSLRCPNEHKRAAFDALRPAAIKRKSARRTKVRYSEKKKEKTSDNEARKSIFSLLDNLTTRAQTPLRQQRSSRRTVTTRTQRAHRPRTQRTVTVRTKLPTRPKTSYASRKQRKIRTRSRSKCFLGAGFKTKKRLPTAKLKRLSAAVEPLTAWGSPTESPHFPRIFSSERL